MILNPTLGLAVNVRSYCKKKSPEIFIIDWNKNSGEVELLDEQERTEFARLENSLEYARVMLSDKQYLDFKIEIEIQKKFFSHKQLM